VVVDLPDSASGNGNRRLVAYAEVAEGEALGIGEVRRFLRAKLPDSMLPAAFVPLERLPLNPSGKVDRRALPDPSGARPALETEYAAPREGREAALAALWREVLGVERVGVHDNFFDLGGHSLLLMRLQGRIAAETGIDLPVLELFEHPTVASLARRLDERGAGSEEDGEAASVADTGEERAGELRRGKERRARRLARRTSDVEI
jgi:aryl carrier-like protein